MVKQQIAYATMVGDLFHRGHLEFIKNAKKTCSKLIIGLHPDDIVQKYKRLPIVSFEDRKEIIQSIKYVDHVVEDCLDYRSPTLSENIIKYNIDLLIHGDDWLPDLYTKMQKKQIVDVLQIPFYPYMSTTSLLKEIRESKKLKNLLKEKKKITLVSAGDAISAKLIEEAEFDGIWVSGFEASARLGLADNGSITMTEMLSISKAIVESSSLPVVVDVDNGYGGIHNFIRTVKEFEKIGCAAVCVEDNIFPKKNSLWGGKTELLSMEEHGSKIKAGKEYQKTKEFMIVARTEALIRDYGMKEAIKRANYYADCGADMILIHSRDTTGKEALEIPKNWKRDVPLVIVPTKFSHIKNSSLFDAGFSVVILANQTERVKIKSIRQFLKEVKASDTINAVEKSLSASLEDLRNLTPVKLSNEIENKYLVKK
jgi:cytidyltransferase-like protein